jgi:hypothetical protein
MNATRIPPAPTTTTNVAVGLLVTLLTWSRACVWCLCAGGLTMGYFISQAHQIRSARFTALGGLPGWPEVWGYTLMALGAIALLGRMVGTRGVRIRAVKLFDGNDLAAVAMLGMAFWYTVFASSLILGTAEYGFIPYLTLAGLHMLLAVLVHRTDGLRFFPAAVV